MIKPNYIFEVSWEVCNKVGGIYTVLSSKALNMKKHFDDNIIFIGPDIWDTADNQPIDFTETDELTDFKRHIQKHKEIKIKVGRWNIPGSPIAILVDFAPIYKHKNDIYGNMWNKFGVNSINAYGDYDEASMFGYASGEVIDAFVEFHSLKKQKIIAHFNEWMTAFGLLYIKTFCPNIKTLFTTHATTVGRSIAGNGKPLYKYLKEYNGTQMSKELNVESKHSVEKTAAFLADCFTTVSDITATECEELLDKRPDIVTPNGFENDFVPGKEEYIKKRKKARKTFTNIAEKKLGYKLSKKHLFIGISGRYEYKNKGIDVFIDVMNALNTSKNLDQQIIAFIIVPAWVKNNCYSNSKYVTSSLMNEEDDPTINYIKQRNLQNQQKDNVKIIFIPTYLNGNDGILNVPYYDILIGLDLTIFPSYYEPWGYTPMESAAFGIPTITTSLSGFGQWVSQTPTNIENGISVINRNDDNYCNVIENITKQVTSFAQNTTYRRTQMGKIAKEKVDNALWNNLFDYYLKAYDIALRKNN